MESFLREVFSDESSQEEKIERIEKEIKRLKSYISECIKDKYANLELYLEPSETLLKNSQQLLYEIKSLQATIDNQIKVKLSASSTALHNLSQELKEYNYGLLLSGQLLEIQRCFDAMEDFKTSKSKYCVAAAHLVTLHSIVVENNSEIKALQIYGPIKEEYYRLYDKFVEEILDAWSQNVNWSEAEQISQSKHTALSIRCDRECLCDIVETLYLIHRLDKCVEAFGKKLLRNFLEPIVRWECKVKGSNATLSLEILDEKELPDYKSVLHNLKTFFKFLHENFNLRMKDDKYFLKKLSTRLFKEFSNMLTNDCISKIIPTSVSQLESFAHTVSEVEDLQNYLVEIGFISEEEKFLSKYTSDINKLYIDKKCKKLLEVARAVMKKDLHDSFRYQEGEKKEFVRQDSKDWSDIVGDRKLSECMFSLPECQISKSAQEILNLVEEILSEACLTLDKYMVRLFYTSRNIFEMYAALVPEMHRSFLETIPQQVALFHNNCFYLAHHLLTLSHKYNTKMQTDNHDFSMTYVDQSLLLRKVGSEYFLNHMKYQRDIILGILRESGLSSIGQMPTLPVTTERALRQCIRQLELLKTVWIEILPVKVYCRTLGCIMNDMVDDLCTKLTSVEDIPADIASELVTLFDIVVKRVPQIFPEPALMEHHVQKWRKFKELIVVLGASLKEIEERWADGKGPLASEFTSQHVKQLIRALFQNTERRSNLLSKIREK